MEAYNLQVIDIQGAPDTGAPEGMSPIDIRVTCNTQGDITRQNIQYALGLGLQAVDVLPANDRILAIVGGGPSLSDSLPIIKAMQDSGVDVWALNNVPSVLNAHGIVPQSQIIIDPRPQNAEFLNTAAHSWIIASQCNKAVFDALSDRLDRTGLFHSAGSALEIEGVTCIGGSVTVGLTSMCLAYTVGYRAIHLFGFDGSYRNDAHHAYPQEQSEQEARTLEVSTYDKNGDLKQFVTNFAMAKQAELFPSTAKLLLDGGCTIAVHGSGLLPTIAQAMGRK